MSSKIRMLRNIGPLSSRWLRDAGLIFVDQLRSLGPVAVYQLLQSKGYPVSRNLLWALAAGLQDRDWRELTLDEKSQLEKQLLE